MVLRLYQRSYLLGELEKDWSNWFLSFSLPCVTLWWLLGYGMLLFHSVLVNKVSFSLFSIFPSSHLKELVISFITPTFHHSLSLFYLYLSQTEGYSDDNLLFCIIIFYFSIVYHSIKYITCQSISHLTKNLPLILYMLIIFSIYLQIFLDYHIILVLTPNIVS